MDAYRAQLMSYQLKGSLEYVTVSLEDLGRIVVGDHRRRGQSGETNMESL